MDRRGWNAYTSHITSASENWRAQMASVCGDERKTFDEKKNHFTAWTMHKSWKHHKSTQIHDDDCESRWFSRSCVMLHVIRRRSSSAIWQEEREKKISLTTTSPRCAKKSSSTSTHDLNPANKKQQFYCWQSETRTNTKTLDIAAFELSTHILRSNHENK